MLFSFVSSSCRKAERRVSVLKREKEECVLKEEKTRHYMGAVLSVAGHISLQRDQLLQMVLPMRLVVMKAFVCHMVHMHHVE